MVASYALGPMFLYLLMLGGWGLPLGIPPGPEDPVLAKVAPAECLVYLSWAGTARPDPKSKNQTEQLLAEPEVRVLVAEIRRLFRSGAKQMARNQEAEAVRLGENLQDVAETILRHPAAVFLSGVSPAGGRPEVRGAVVVRLGDDLKQFHSFLEEIQDRVWKDRVRSAQFGGRGWYRISLGEGLPAILWGSHQGYLIAAVGEGELESLLKRMHGEPPAWLAAVRKGCAVPRPANTVYVNIKGILDLAWPRIPDPQAKAALETLGLRSVTHLASMTGLDETGVVTRAVLGLEGDNLGIFRLADAPPLTPADLTPIPRDATIAAAFRLEPERAFETFVDLLGKIDPRAKEGFSRDVRGLDAEVGFSLRDDVLKSLGSVWCVYAAPSGGGVTPSAFTAVVRVKDSARLAKAHGQLMARLREEFSGEDRSDGRSPQYREFRFAGHDIHYLGMGRAAFGLGVFAVPSWCLTRNELILGLSPQSVKAVLSRASGSPSLARSPEVAKLFAAGKAPVKLFYVDTAEVFRSYYPWVQTMLLASSQMSAGGGPQIDLASLPSPGAIARHLRPTVAAVWRTPSGIEMVQRQTLPVAAIGPSLLAGASAWMPAIGGARFASQQSRSMNNLKQIGLALHNYADVHRAFPPAYSVNKEGKPLLSWRVHILPYIEQSQLYEQFHLDEPWDSEHNKKLLATVPATYRSPTSKAAAGKTAYLAVSGPRSVFPGKEPIGFARITDGTSNTVMVVETPDALAVEWTRPDDFVPDAKDPAKRLLDSRKSVLGLFADGSVRALSGSLSAETWSALFTRDGGEVISRDQLDGRPPATRLRPARRTPVMPPPASAEPRSEAPAGPFTRAREAARRSQSINNLKQIALALHNYHDTFKTFPAASYPDEKGKPRLSWRVAILPFVEGNQLYREFRFGEPWDSEHNKRLIERMPDVYRSPSSRAAEGKTNYLTVRGPRTVFPGPGKQVGIRDILDGTSNTIMVVEASDPRAVIWTKPDDFEPDPNDPIRGLVGLQADGFLACLADGSVHYFRAKMEPDTLRALFDRADGQAINADRWRIRGR